MTGNSSLQVIPDQQLSHASTPRSRPTSFCGALSQIAVGCLCPNARCTHIFTISHTEVQASPRHSSQTRESNPNHGVPAGQSQRWDIQKHAPEDRIMKDLARNGTPTRSSETHYPPCRRRARLYATLPLQSFSPPPRSARGRRARSIIQRYPIRTCPPLEAARCG